MNKSSTKKPSVLDVSEEELSILEKVEKYILNNKERIVDKGIEYLLSKNPSYSEKLKKNLKDFRKSLIEGHFQWLIADTKNPNNIDFDKKYKEYMTPPFTAYCDFYIYLLESIKGEIEITKYKSLDIALEDYYIFLRDEMCKSN
jgi:hypothetical protein